MPSKTPKEAHLMAAVAHGWKKPGGGGPSVAVAKEFNQADKGTRMLSNGSKGRGPQAASYAAGGQVLGTVSRFLKQPSPYNTGHTKSDYEGGKPKGDDKSLKPVVPRK
jgi:hypothetical protein